MIRFAIVTVALSCSSAAIVEPAPECIADQVIGPVDGCGVVCAYPPYRLSFSDSPDACADAVECLFAYDRDVLAVARPGDREPIQVERIWWEKISCEEWWR